jgi:hypothetical protein
MGFARRTYPVTADAIGPDGTVRLRCYLPSADTVWLSAGCDGLASCGHAAPISIRAAVRLMGPDAMVRQLARRLRCSLRQPPNMARA